MAICIIYVELSNLDFLFEFYLEGWGLLFGGSRMITEENNKSVTRTKFGVMI